MILLDTHIWHWWLSQIPGKLSSEVIARIEFADSIAVSAISCFEMAWLIQHKRIDPGMTYEEWFELVSQDGFFSVLPVTGRIASMAVALPEHHKDPHDRMIIATALYYGCQIISFDHWFSAYTELDGLLINNVP